MKYFTVTVNVKGNSCRKTPIRIVRQRNSSECFRNWGSIKPVSKNRPKNINRHYEI